MTVDNSLSINGVPAGTSPTPLNLAKPTGLTAWALLFYIISYSQGQSIAKMKKR
jgi:hypothetical protein